MVSPHKCLRVNEVEEQAAYRGAVAEILRNIQMECSITLLDISETIGISLGTVSNAANKKADLSTVFLTRLGKAFGAHVLSPVIRLSGGQVVAIDNDGAEDVLPLVTKVAAEIADARTPKSPGGVVETLRQQLGYLPYLRRLYREIGALISQIEARKEAA